MSAHSQARREPWIPSSEQPPRYLRLGQESTTNGALVNIKQIGNSMFIPKVSDEEYKTISLTAVILLLPKIIKLLNILMISGSIYRSSWALTHLRRDAKLLSSVLGPSNSQRKYLRRLPYTLSRCNSTFIHVCTERACLQQKHFWPIKEMMNVSIQHNKWSSEK